MADEATTKDDTLSLLKEQFEEWFQGTKSARALAEKCRDYRDGNQWTDNELKTLEKRGQPPLTDNKIADKCDALLGIERQMRTDPKAFPRTPKHEQDAEAATDALRYVADDNDFQRSVRQACADNLMVEGLAYLEIEVEKYEGEQQPKICQRHIRWDRGFYDIHALKPDFGDKRYCGFSTWMDNDAALELYPGKDAALTEASQDEGTSDATTDDKPRYLMTSNSRKRSRIVTHYFQKKGQWHKAVWCVGGYLEDPKPCTYVDEHKQPQCPMEIQAVYRDRNGHPYGPTKNWLDRQDGINKRKSKLMHLLNTKQIIAPKGAFPDIETESGVESGIKVAREQLHRPDGVVEYADGFGDKVEFRDNLTMAEGQWRLLVHDVDSLAGTGPNAALLGQTGSVSGLAKQVDQQAGTLTVAPLFEALSALQLRCHRQTWCRVMQFWTGEMWIRVTDDDKNSKFVGLNQPIYNGDLAAEELAESDYPPEQKAEFVRMIAADPESQKPALDENNRPMLKHNVAEMDVDIILDESADVVNVQSQEFAMIVEVAKARPEVPFEVVLELSQLRSTTKKRVMDKMSGNDNPAAQKMAQLQEAMATLELALKQATVRKTEADAAKSEAAASETGVDSAVKVASYLDPPQQAAKTSVAVS